MNCFTEMQMTAYIFVGYFIGMVTMLLLRVYCWEGKRERDQKGGKSNG